MLRVLSLVLLTLLVAAGILAGTGYLLERRARDFSTKAASDIYKDWDIEAVRPHAVTELRRKMTSIPDELKKTFQLGSELGPLQELGRPIGGMGVRWGGGVPTRGLYGHYEFNARFQGGEAQIMVDLLWESGDWRIAGTRFNSPELYDKWRARK